MNYAGPLAPPGTATVNITIGDINDHVPMFNQSDYNITVQEGIPIGASVFQLPVSDRDSGLHSQLEFQLIGASEFVIDTSLGIIRTAAEIDREMTSSYFLTVTVRNPGNAAFNLARVYVTILDVDDSPPILVLSPNTATLQEPQTLVTLATRLEITDQDLSPSLDYALVEVLDQSNSTNPGALIATVNSATITILGNTSRKLELRGDDQSLDEFERVLRGVVYQDLAAEPAMAARMIAYQVGSHDSNRSSGPIELQYQPANMVSNVSLFTVSVVLINDNPPQLLLDTRDRATLNFSLPDCNTLGSFSTEFTEGSPPVSLSHDSLTITDADSGSNVIHFAVVEIMDPQDLGFEVLSVQVSGGVTVRSGSSPKRIVLDGPATLYQFATVLRTVRYTCILCIYACTHNIVCVCMYVCMYVCMCLCMYVCVYMCVCMCIYVCMYIVCML